MELTIRNKINHFLDQAIKAGLIVFVFGSPFSISLAQIGLVPAIVFWLIQLAVNKFQNIKGTFLDLPILILLAGQLITSIVCTYSKNAFASYQGEWQILMVYLIFSRTDITFQKKMLKVLFFVAVVISIYGIYQHFFGWDIIRQRHLHCRIRFRFTELKFILQRAYDIVGGFGMHLTFGGYYMMVALLSIAYFFREKSSKWFYITGTILITLVTVGSYARTAWLGLLSGIVILIFLSIKSRTKIILSFLSLLLITASLIYFIPSIRGSALSFSDFRVSRRAQIYRVALLMIKDHPIFGVGNGNFKKHYHEYSIKKKIHKSDPRDVAMGHPHNDVFNIYLTTGLIGLIGYLLMWFRLMKNGIRYIRQNGKEKYLMAGLVSGLTAFFIAGLGQNYYTDSENSMLFWLFVSVTVSLCLQGKEQKFPVLR